MTGQKSPSRKMRIPANKLIIKFVQISPTIYFFPPEVPIADNGFGAYEVRPKGEFGRRA